MATSRPDFLPAWATLSFALALSGQQNKVRPPLAWRQNGWDENEEPAVNYENWMKSRIYQFLEFQDLNAIRSATAFVAASDATDPMIDMANAEGTGLNKWTCDGVGDDVQIQAAIDAVEAAGGGVVLLSEGTFSFLGGLTIDTSNVTLAGMGRGATILQVAASSAFSFDVITLDTVSNCMVRDLAIDGNKANQVAPGTETFYGIVMDAATHCIVKDVNVHDLFDVGVAARGIQVKGATSANNIIERCRIYNGTALTWDIDIVAGAGAVVERCRVSLGIQVAAADSRIVDNHVLGDLIAIINGGIGSIVQGNRIVGGQGGVYVTGVSGVTVEGNHITEVTESGIHVDTCTNIAVIGNHIRLCGWDGIVLVATDHSLVSSNKIESCSQAAHNGHDGIAIEDGCDNVAVVSNQVRGLLLAVQHRFGMYISNGGVKPTGIWTNNNDFWQGGLVLFSDAGVAGADFPGNGQSWDGAIPTTVLHFNRI